jgi:hypothetical protein
MKRRVTTAITIAGLPGHLGHLVALEESQNYKPALKQRSMETLPIVPERFGLKPLDEMGRQAAGGRPSPVPHRR